MSIQNIASNEEIREAILRVLYDQHKTARGIKGVSLGFKQIYSKVRNQLKPKKVKQQDLSHNLDYLIQSGWVVKEEQKTYIKNLRMPGSKNVYKISDEGIRRMEPMTEFMPINSPYSGINIQAIKSAVVIGNNNIVSNNPMFEEILPKLNELEKIIKSTKELSEEAKLNLVNDLKSLEFQAAKSNPDKKIIERILKNIVQAFSDIGKSVAVAMIVKMIASHFGVVL